MQNREQGLRPLASETILQRVLEEITAAIKHLRYGRIVITVHDAQIAEIEKSEKKRFFGQPDHRR